VPGPSRCSTPGSAGSPDPSSTAARDFPPITSMFVPGDRVAIAFDSRGAAASEVLGTILPRLKEAVEESGEITVVSTVDLASAIAAVPRDVRLIRHDPADRVQLAYLATTKQGRRVYLNRQLTDADVVIAVGELGFDPKIGIRGPWSVIFPELSDEATRSAFGGASSDPGETATSEAASNPLLQESLEASWLLGSQFSIGLLPGRSGFSGVVAGLGTSVCERSEELLNRDWRLRAESRAEMVVAGVGQPDSPTSIEDLVDGLTTAAGLVQHGGKVVMLSRAEGSIGPALRRLSQAGEPRLGAKALKGHESDPDFELAIRLNKALAWADVYLLSALDSQIVEDLSMVPLEKPGEAARLVSNSHSTIFLSQANLARVSVADEA